MRPTNVWCSRGNPGDDNGCPEFPRERGPANAPNYGAPRPSCARTSDNDGMTVMDGPVYRYDEDARTTPAAGRSTGTAAGSCTTAAARASSTRLLLDPATDQDGGQPIYADSLRDALNWDAAYMDSKFGPDGALYVQVYDGFFRAGANAGIWRFDYTGGPATPGASPKAFPIGDNEVRFSSAGSGGVSYEWDFGDGTPSRRRRTRRTPTRRPKSLHRDADRHLRGRQHGRQAGRRSTSSRPSTTTAPLTTATTDPATRTGPVRSR